ncbi:type II secretion system F family protein [Jatrophihabitans sp.]|uniref:type II secretion system F family protein n=1 Tax=Jatrophihabitans sp. TaxID=1932789 RepID=UPI002C128BD3|nr:type II secretion system F family protein [Jatrophihabitans sp.]
MPNFSYTATMPSGKPARGTEKASSREAAELALYERDLRDIRVEPRKSLLKTEITAPRVKRDELMHLSRQLGAFIRAGLPLIDAVHTIGMESANSSVRKMMAEVEQSLRDGERLSTCLDRHPKIFPAFYRGILRSAELTGHLDTVLEQLATYLERDIEARRKVKSAMIYPSMIAGMSVFTIAVLAGFVLPRFKVFFKSLHAKLPLPTRMLLAVTDFLTAYWWVILAVLAALALIGWLALRTEGGRYARDRFVLGVPVLGSTVQYALVERFSRILSSMVSAGVTLPEALRVASESLHNLVFERALSQVTESMLEGGGLAGPLARTGLFPSTASLMMQVGEQTGTLDTQLEATAHYYEGELDYKIKKLTSLFEPAIILVMGGLVGFVAIALVSAMYGIFNQVKV